jgi:DNA repair protein RecO (recombination protein O)
MLAKDHLLILRVTRYGEADLIVTALSRSGRSLSLIAKSALKSKKRFGGGVLEPTHYVRATYKSPPEGSDKMGVLLEAELIEPFSGLRESYERLEIALYFLSVVEKVCRDGQTEAEALFDLLGNALRAAEKGRRLSELKTIFEIKFLDQQGVLPHEPEFASAIHLPTRKLPDSDLETDLNSKERIRELLASYIRM